jgi:GNS1/SUR4 family
MVKVWNLNIPNDSIDGKPIVTAISELLWDIHQFPYHRLPTSANTTNTFERTTQWISSWFLQPEVVGTTLLFYVFLSKPLMKYIRNNIFHWNRRPHPQVVPYWFQYCIILHNALLAIFSAVCAYNSVGIIMNHIYAYGLYDTYCNNINSTFWNDGFGSWAIVFYVSKYYEFVDTWILIFKGKEASFLQVYHHTGIAYIMWCAVLSQSSWLLFVVSLNSIIHTLMYTYFCIKSISPTTEISIAKYLTMAQIGQFFTGILCTIPIFIYGESCDTESSRFALACLHTYGFGLIALFITFAQKKYKKKEE